MNGTITKQIAISLLILTSFACSFPVRLLGMQEKNINKLSKISFCADVSDAGECIGPGNSFPSGTEAVFAYFTYQDMKDGQKWSRVWLQDGELYDEARDEIWDGGAQGWIAYSIEDTNGISGKFTLSISLDREEVQTASFVVEPSKSGVSSGNTNSPSNFPAFGPITIAESASENAFPIGAANRFEFGIKEIVAVFPYSNMSSDMSYIAEWIRDGKELIRKEYPWEDTAAGMHFTSLSDENPLSAGKYTLNLFLQDELVRTSNFEISGEPTSEPLEQSPDATISPEQRPDRPATPEEVVDNAAIEYFYKIYQSNLPVLHQVANDNLAGWTRVEVVDENPCGEGAVACFKSTCDKRWGGTVYLIKENMEKKQDFEITQDLVHELTHGMEHYDGMKCGCTIQKEFYAFAAEYDYLIYSGHKDFFDEEYAGIYDANGRIDTGHLWDVIKEGYGPNCPEY